MGQNHKSRNVLCVYHTRVADNQQRWSCFPSQLYVIVVTALFVSVAVKKELSMDGAGNAARPKQKNLGGYFDAPTLSGSKDFAKWAAAFFLSGFLLGSLERVSRVSRFCARIRA
jgi:hypothetical protein